MRKYVALSGGVGGAKLASGLAAVLPPGSLTLVVNTADDFEHLGLRICPDLDSVMYALAGVNDSARGWGRAGETWQCMDALRELGGPGWFQLGDRDLAVHLMRTHALAEGATLTRATRALCSSFGIRQEVLPMTDNPVCTELDTVEGTFEFQAWFVGRSCAPTVRGLHYRGAAQATPCRQVLDRLSDPELAGVVVCPSNPYLSIDPILAVPGLRQALQRVCVPVVAVSPYVGGVAVKGPADRLAHQLGERPDALHLARRYQDFLHGMVSDECSPTHLPGDVVHRQADTWMPDLAAQRRLAGVCLDTIGQLGRRL